MSAKGHKRTFHYLFDYIVSTGEQCRRYIEAERLRRLEIDYQLESGRLLYWNFARLGATQNFINIFGGASELIGEARAIGHQTSRFDEFPIIGGRRQPRAQRQGVGTNPVGGHEWVTSNIESICARLETLGLSPSARGGGREFREIP
jgi:hypothetical protein